MKGIAFLSGLFGSLITLGILPVTAQVTSDNTTNTTVNSTGNNFNILNGIQKGNNLFHSFGEFSIPTGSSATFNNSTDVVNIINRVTGGNVSNIDGLIKSQGNANLFLINPAGIVFGENASLDIGGSFLGSTAESILFEDGFEFSAVNAQTEPLLTVSVPLGLQMGQNPGAIAVKGSGHPLTRPPIAPIVGTAENIGLGVKSGETLALIGGEINLDGGILTTPGGHLELGSVQDAEVSLNLSSQPWQFSYNSVQNFQDINLLNQALVDASGLGGGSIQLQGNNIDIQDGSLVIIRNFGSSPSGNININAANNLNINGTTPDGSLASGVFGQIVETGTGGDIVIKAEEALLSDGGVIVNETYSPAAGGNIIIDVVNTLELSGFSPINPLATSAITSTSFSDGDGGELTISSRNLLSDNGGVISTTTFGKGNSGDLTINASDSVKISIDGFISVFPSSITAESLNAGNAGNLKINTGKLSLIGGGSILATARASGKAGDILINASESINIADDSIGSQDENFSSQINSSAEPLPIGLALLFGTPALPSGDSGSIKINTPILKLEDNGLITVSNAGTGDAGNLNINAESVSLNKQGGITATTASGEGGNINLNLQSDLILRNNSLIDTEALGTGNGGNITINSPVIAGFENSDVIANAVEGNGGNINITTQGIFGLKFRNKLTPESDITASSKFGINGTVKINNLSIDPSSGLVELPVNLADSSQQISNGCASQTGSSFVTTGRGGIPHNPNQYLNLNNTWSDIRDLSAFSQRDNNIVGKIQISNQSRIIEATGFIKNENGEIELVAVGNTTLRNNLLSECSRINT